MIVYDAQHDDLSSITGGLEALVASTGQRIGTIAVMGHGADSIIWIGSDKIYFSNVADYSASLEGLGALLAEDGQIQFYGCSVAKDATGQALVDRIASLTSADVYASTDDTGGADGDWKLEFGSLSSSDPMTLLFSEQVLISAQCELATGYVAEMVKDICTTGSPDSSPSNLTNVNGTLFFMATDAKHGTELWKSDGTAEGTVLVKDINVGGSSSPSYLTNLNGTCSLRRLTLRTELSCGRVTAPQKEPSWSRMSTRGFITALRQS